MHSLHNIPPVYNADSEVLILGSFPSVRSRADGFFYAHPRNRFWQVLASVYGLPVPRNTDEKKHLLLSCRVALWDVAASCDVDGSSDTSIQNVTVNPVGDIIKAARVTRIYTNGTTATRLYNKYLYPQTGIPAVMLPSTSPANASVSLDRLCDKWKSILQ